MMALLGWFCLIAAALAAPPTAESTWTRWSTMNDLELAEDLARPLEQPIQLKQGPTRVRLEGGFLVPVFSGRFGGAWSRDANKILRQQRIEGAEPRLPTAEERGSRELVGFVWTGGTGTMAVELTDRADGLILANHLVRRAGGEREELTGLAHGE